MYPACHHQTIKQHPFGFCLIIYIYLDFEVVVFKLQSMRGSICSSRAKWSEARELQILPQVLRNLKTNTEKSKYLYYYHLNF